MEGSELGRRPAAAAEILKANQGDNLGVLVHPSTSNEEGALLARLAKGLGTGNIDHRINNRDFSDAATAEVFGLPLAEIEGADRIVVLGSNIRHELPLLHGPPAQGADHQGREDPCRQPGGLRLRLQHRRQADRRTVEVRRRAGQRELRSQCRAATTPC